MLTEITDALGLTDPWTFFAVFLGASLLMLWRLEAMLKHGLEGTALGTLVMPYCSGLGNLLFVFIMVQRGGAAKEVLTNSIVNNVTNLTLLLGLPAVFWGLAVVEDKSAGSSAGKAKRSGTRASSGVAPRRIFQTSGQPRSESSRSSAHSRFPFACSTTPAMPASTQRTITA